jgi:hypothetical protein
MKKILLILFTLSICGCASITGSKNQPLSVTATLEGKPVMGANCELLNDKGKWFVTTPASVVILKSYQDLSITCRKPETKKVGATTFQSKNETGVWGNLITGGIIGYAVDAGTGAGFSYPPTLNVPMLYGDAITPFPVEK